MASKFKLDTSGFDKLEKQIDNALHYITEVKALLGVVAKRLDPIVQPMLMAAYARSDITSRSGELERMVAGSTCRFTKKGNLFIAMPAGFSKKSYAKAGAQQYGALHRSGTSGKGRKSLKKLISVEGVGKTGTIYFEPNPYYELTDSDVDTIGEKLTELLNEELNKRIKR